MKNRFLFPMLNAGLLALSFAVVAQAAAPPGLDAGMLLNQAVREQQMRNTNSYMFQPFSPADASQWRVPDSNLFQVKATRKVNPDSLFAQALDSFEARDYARAVEKSNAVIKAKSSYTNAYIIRGTSQLYLHNYQEAYKDANKVIGQKPDNKYGYALRSAVNLFKYKPNESIADCEKTLSLDPGNAYAYSICSVGYTIINNQEKAMDYAGKALAKNPKLPEAYLARGYNSVMQGDFKQALADGNQIVELYPQAALGYTLRATAKLAMDKSLEEAMADARKSVSLNPNLPFNYVVLGTAYGQQHEDVKTIQNLETAIQLYEQNGSPSKAEAIRSYLNEYKSQTAKN